MSNPKNMNRKREVINQHYVPRLYLKRFTSDGRTIYAFDKANGKLIGTNIINIAQERYYYDLPELFAEAGFDVQLAEQTLKRGEDKFNLLIEAILQDVEAKGILEIYKGELCQHLHMQWVRTPECRNAIAEVLKKIKKNFATTVCLANNWPLELRPIINVSEDEKKLRHHQLMFDKAKKREIMLAMRHCIWFIGINRTEQPLYTSDNPIVRQAHVSDPEIGGVGIDALGVEFIYPLTPKYALFLRERTYFKYNTIRENQAVTLEREEVDRINRLQLMQCSRHVFCHTNQFEYAQKLREEHPELMAADRERWDVYNRWSKKPDTTEMVEEMVVQQRLDCF